ncbi:hypothetical protein PHYPSEUDO_003992 [Phytophthora pseudosyringae]|uniref:Saposin B-type domain-containing protein n=1 Tax=Phytophthora pseudosyringae TaxID=221518 RepID=A0A8T1VT57_9STRA|nr:hypothetical protein PHYPSEUDO_003992 [Phytophthora pseudosyringae]
MRALLLSLAAASAVASAERGMRHGMRHPEAAEMPCHHEQEQEGEDVAAGLMAALNEQFQRSSELLQSFFRLDETQDDVVRVVILEEEEDPALERKRACLKALQKIHEQDELQAETETLMRFFRSAFDTVSLQVWGETSCEELERPELVEQCNLVVKSEDAVRKFLLEGKTDDEVCDIMSTVSDLEGADNLSCKLCQRFVQMIDQALAQEVQQVQQVRAIIGDLCDAMSSDSMCHTFLKNYDAIVDWLKHGTEPLVVCARIAMCSSESGSGSEISDLPLTPEEPKTVEDGALVTANFVENDQSCTFCSHVAGVIYQVNELFPEQLPMLKSVLGTVCEMASPESKCQEVEANFDHIVELVQQGQYPREVCANADFCPKKPMRDMLPSDRMRGGDKTCVYCDAATTVVEVILQEAPEQIDQIREYADMICGMLGDDSPCHQYVNQLDTVVDSLRKGVHPRDICKTLKYCSAERMDNLPELDESPRVGMMRNGPGGMHHHVGMMGPGGRHGHHGRGPRGEMAMMQDNEHPPHPPRPHPHGSCFFCSRVAMVIHHVNHTSPEKLPIVKTILSNVCQLVPSKCKCDVVDKNFDKIVEMEKEGKHPHEICKSLGVCDKTRGWEEGAPSIADEMKGVVVASQWPPGNATQCTYCQFATTVAKIALQQYGTDIRQIRAYADMICDMLGSDSPCHIYVKDLDFVIDSITKGMSAKAICLELKFCTAMEGQLDIADGEESAVALSSDKHRHHDHGCSFCIHVGIVVHHVNKTEPEKLPIVKTILTNVCKLATPDCKCDEVDKNFGKVVELGKGGKRPHEICKTIGLCKKKVDVIADGFSLTDAVSALIADTRPAPEGDTKTCFFCDYVTSLVQAAYEQDSTKILQIKQLADTACELLGEECGCHEYVVKLDFVLDSLKNGTHPHAICQSMKYCAANNTLAALAPQSSNSDLSAYDPILVQLVKESMEVSVDGCFFCTQVASVIEVAVAEDPSKITQIRQIADVVCGMLPSDNQCHSFVKQFDTVVDSLQKGEQPKAICHDLKYCTVDTNPAMAKLAVPDMIAVQNGDKGSNTCAYCSGIVTVLKYALAQKPEQVKEMREAAGIVCQLLPADDTCHDDLKMFDEAVTDLQAGKEPQEICQALKFCTATETPNDLLSGLFDFTGADFLPSRCTTCQQNTLLLASLITRPDSLATFEREINSICRLIPESSECELLMKHQDAIIDSLKKNEDVDTICTRIAECGPAAVEEVQEEKSMSVGCLFCEYTVDLLEFAKDDEKALREAKVTLETMCTVLPPRARCDVLSSKFDELVSLMREGKSSSEACHSIALCDANFVYSGSREDDPFVQAFEKGRQSTGNLMEIQ